MPPAVPLRRPAMEVINNNKKNRTNDVAMEVCSNNKKNRTNDVAMEVCNNKKNKTGELALEVSNSKKNKTSPQAIEVSNKKNKRLVVDINHNHVPAREPGTPTSPNPLDNDIFKPQSPRLSAFGDYVDLVKRHLMYAVREEVEILKQQIGEMMEKIGQLEYENTILRSEAKPETLSKLLQPRVIQTPQVLPGQNAPLASTSNPQPVLPQPVSQSQPLQQVIQTAPQQQHASQSPLSQASQLPST